MPTIKDLKKELDKRWIVYPKNALKSVYEALLEAADMSAYEVSERESDIIIDPPMNTFERISQKHGHKPDYIDREDDFIDPNADPGTQA